MKKQEKVVKLQPYSKGCPESPFGHLEGISIPEASTVIKQSIPNYAKDLKFENVAEISEQELSKIIKKAKRYADEVAELLLHQETPALMSLDQANNFVSATLQDSLGFAATTTEDDISVIINNITRLSVIYFYIKKTKLPVGFKRRYFRKMVDLLAEQSMKDMQKEREKEQQRKRVKEMEVVVKRRSEINSNKGQGNKEVENAPNVSPIGATRSRST